MGKFLKENWFKICILMVLGFVAAVFVYFYTFYVSQNKLATDLNNQEKCSKQAESFVTDFRLNKNPDARNIDSRNHYNSELKKCFVLVYFTDDYSQYLFDPFEGKEYGEFIHTNINDTGHVCALLTQDKLYCTEKEFNVYIKTYMQE